MQKTFTTLFTALSSIMILMVVIALAQATAVNTAAPWEKAERHPKINQAIKALEAARGDLQNAAHDYCGHRVEALEATNQAIKQLGLALASDHAANDQGKRSALVLASYHLEVSDGARPAPAGSKVSNAGERHPLIERAITALEAAKNDMQHAADDFHGHKAEALEATNGALNQLRAALACDKK